MDSKRKTVEDSCKTTLYYFKNVITQYCDKKFKEYALTHVPIDYINKNVDIRVKESFKLGCHPFVLELIYLKELVTWFKHYFFRWMESPVCITCQEKMICTQTRRSKESIYVTAVEEYRCTTCSATDSLKRYIDPRILLMTREGRCSEYSLCFTLICLALGMRARYVVDLSDHCWTEVYSPYRHYWIHIDPSEGIVNQPLLYELGWNKKLTYIFSIGETDIQDVTWRYSSNHSTILSRRQSEMNNFIDDICSIRYSLLKDLPYATIKKELLLVIEELAQLLYERKPEGSYNSRISGV